MISGKNRSLTGNYSAISHLRSNAPSQLGEQKKMEIESKYSQQFLVVEELLQLGRDIFREKISNETIKDDNEYNLPMLMIYTRFLKSNAALIDLCRSGFGEDAGTILRTMLEQVLNFFYLSKDPSRNGLLYMRSQLVTRLESHRKLRRLAPEAMQEEFDWMVDEVKTEEALKARDEEIFKIDNTYDKDLQKKADALGRWSGKSLRQMADESEKELLWQYDLSYWMFSDFVHGNPSWCGSTVAYEPTNRRISLSDQPSERYVEAILLGSGEYLLNLVIKANEFFSLGKQKEIEQAKTRFYAAGTR